MMHWDVISFCNKKKYVVIKTIESNTLKIHLVLIHLRTVRRNTEIHQKALKRISYRNRNIVCQKLKYIWAREQSIMSPSRKAFCHQAYSRVLMISFALCTWVNKSWCRFININKDWHYDVYHTFGEITKSVSSFFPSIG